MMMSSFNKLSWCVLFSMLSLVLAQNTDAAEFVGMSGDRSASAMFDVDTQNNQLIVTLTNTSVVEAAGANDVLTAVFFDSTMPLDLTRESAVLAMGSSVLHPKKFGDGTDPNIPNGVGGEWAYRNDLLAGELSGSELGSQQYGISSTGLSKTFEADDRFAGENLVGSSKGTPSGISYGLVSQSTTATSGNMSVQKRPIVNHSVVFTFSFNSGVPQGFNPASHITDVVFQYGDKYSRPQVVAAPFNSPFAVPEPVTATLSFMSMGFIMLMSSRRHR